MNFFPNIRQKGVQLINAFKGFTTYDNFSIADGYAEVARNLDARNYPAMVTRNPRVRYGNGLPTVTNGIQGIYPYRKFNGTTTVTEYLCVSNAGLYKYALGSWTLIDQTMGGGVAFTQDWQFTSFPVGGVTNVIIKNPGNASYYRYDGTALSGVSVGYGYLNYITSYEKRLYAAVENKLHYSALRSHDDWTTANNAGIIFVEDDTGNVINGLHSSQGRLMVFKENAIYELYGVSPATYRMANVAKDIGIINHKCVLTLNNVTYLLHKSGLYQYTGGRPRRIAEVVQGYFDNMNITSQNRHRYFIGTDGKRLFVNLLDTLLVWYPEHDVWYEWTGFNGVCMMNTTEGASPVIGAVNGRLYGVGNVEGLVGVPDETQVSWEWVSKPFHANVMNQRLRFHRLFVTANINGTLNISISPTTSGATNPTLLKAVTGSTFKQEQFIVPTTAATNANFMQVRLNGVGDVKVHQVVREAKVFPLR